MNNSPRELATFALSLDTYNHSYLAKLEQVKLECLVIQIKHHWHVFKTWLNLSK